jgi:23S rRNA-/tRNA-specific pseudouridylate synthase
MTSEEFESTHFYKGIDCFYTGSRHEIISVNFEDEDVFIRRKGIGQWVHSSYIDLTGTAILKQP